jgi:hypothetical protein
MHLASDAAGLWRGPEAAGGWPTPMSRVSAVLWRGEAAACSQGRSGGGTRWETGHGEGQRWCAASWAPPWDAVMAVEGRNRHARESGGGSPL